MTELSEQGNCIHCEHDAKTCFFHTMVFGPSLVRSFPPTRPSTIPCVAPQTLWGPHPAMIYSSQGMTDVVEEKSKTVKDRLVSGLLLHTFISAEKASASALSGARVLGFPSGDSYVRWRGWGGGGIVKGWVADVFISYRHVPSCTIMSSLLYLLLSCIY